MRLNSHNRVSSFVYLYKWSLVDGSLLHGSFVYGLYVLSLTSHNLALPFVVKTSVSIKSNV